MSLDEFQDDNDELADDYLLYHEGLMAKLAGDLHLAQELLLKSLALKEHSASHRELYEVLLQVGDENEAFPHIEQAYTLNPRELKAATLYAEALYRRGKMEKAKLILEQALQQSNTFGPARKLLEKIEQAAS